MMNDTQATDEWPESARVGTNETFIYVSTHRGLLRAHAYAGMLTRRCECDNLEQFEVCLTLGAADIPRFPICRACLVSLAHALV